MKILSKFTWGLFYLCLFNTALCLSWFVLKPVNFGYSLWYQALAIEQHISRYAPQNNHGKSNFVLTDSQQHLQLFAQINQAIHQDGNGLIDIYYTIKPQGSQHPLLTEAEVNHLQDVAALLNNTTVLVGFCIFILVFVVIAIKYLKLAPLSKTELLWLISTVLITLILAFAFLGFERIFYQLHIWLFPAQHQWFFYYQDSLMSTLMKAPELFIYIALAIFVVAIIIYLWLLSLFRKFIFK